MFCLSPGSMLLCFDRRSKPYLRCTCGVRVFLPSRASLAGIALLAPIAEQIAERMSCDDEFAREQQTAVTAFVTELRALVSSASAAPSDRSPSAARSDTVLHRREAS
jgi:hypothetical protein